MALRLRSCTPRFLRHFHPPENLNSVEVNNTVSQNMTTEERLHQAMLDIYPRAGKETGYWGNYYLRAVKRHGGLATAKRMLRPKKAGKLDKGLLSLIDAGRPDLSVEAIVLSSEFRSLFTEEERAEASRRIESLPSYTKRKAVPPESNHPEELQETERYTEGAVRSVIVNAYERDAKARAACLAKHGYRCIVCRIDFSDVYGEIGKGFIHVHHRKPLAAIRAEYTVNPRSDLVPVCPNCHAMLHTKSPPLGVDELTAIYEKQKSASSRPECNVG